MTSEKDVAFGIRRLVDQAVIADPETIPRLAAGFGVPVLSIARMLSTKRDWDLSHALRTADILGITPRVVEAPPSSTLALAR